MSHASESLALSHQIPLSNRRSNGYSRMSVQEFAPGSLHRMQPQRRTHHPETRHQDSRLLRLDDWYSFFGIGSCCCSARGLLCHGRGTARGRISLISQNLPGSFNVCSPLTGLAKRHCEARGSLPKAKLDQTLEVLFLLQRPKCQDAVSILVRSAAFFFHCGPCRRCSSAALFGNAQVAGRNLAPVAEMEYLALNVPKVRASQGFHFTCTVRHRVPTEL